MIDINLEESRPSLNASIDEFAGKNADYYAAQFAKIQGRTGFTWSWNPMAALFGPFWAAWRGAWGCFWLYIVLELFALVQISRGLFGDITADLTTRYEKILANIAGREQLAAVALKAGNNLDAASGMKIADNLRKVAENVKLEADIMASRALPILLSGIALLFAIKIFEALYANYAYEAQYLRWRSNVSVPDHTSQKRALFGLLFALAVWPLTVYRATVSAPIDFVVRVPVTKSTFFNPVAAWLENGFDWLAVEFNAVFKGITTVIGWMVGALEIVLTETPWPVLMVVIVVIALRLAGARVAIFTGASLTYLALFGLWETSMITVALIGAGTFICLVFGIPLGIWFGKSKRAYSVAEPMLDFMQTMPAFVYLIPIIAFFGTGKPPGVLATIVFAMPPVIRLTALGMQGVPETTKEAGVAFGCNRWQLLINIEIPLAMPSIMTGVNQTILMSLAMVVIASLIGAEGLGANILESLQYAAKGPGLLTGLAILACAMVIDRIVQGSYRTKLDNR